MLHDEVGATAIEYAVIAGFIALIIVTAVRGVGSNLSPIYSNVAANVH
jgi:pilus assembly protein Flp/PilA